MTTASATRAVSAPVAAPSNTNRSVASLKRSVATTGHFSSLNGFVASPNGVTDL